MKDFAGLAGITKSGVPSEEDGREVRVLTLGTYIQLLSASRCRSFGTDLPLSAPGSTNLTASDVPSHPILAKASVDLPSPENA